MGNDYVKGTVVGNINITKDQKKDSGKRIEKIISIYQKRYKKIKK